jgi:hypothetical protein
MAGRQAEGRSTQVILACHMAGHGGVYLGRHVKAVIFTYTNMATEIHGHGETGKGRQYYTSCHVRKVITLCPTWFASRD